MDLRDPSVDALHHPDCCVALSTKLLAKILEILPAKPEQVLSIGSGSGLLENLLVETSNNSLDLIGVEVGSQVNKYLPFESTIIVKGTWALCDIAGNVAAWMFVYPRSPDLIKKYLDAYLGNVLRIIVWIGPKMDWSDYVSIFQEKGLLEVVEVIQDTLAEYETMVVMRRSTT